MIKVLHGARGMRQRADGVIPESIAEKRQTINSAPRVEVVLAQRQAKTEYLSPYKIAARYAQILVLPSRSKYVRAFSASGM